MIRVGERCNPCDRLVGFFWPTVTSTRVGPVKFFLYLSPGLGRCRCCRRLLGCCSDLDTGHFETCPISPFPSISWTQWCSIGCRHSHPSRGRKAGRVGQRRSWRSRCGGRGGAARADAARDESVRGAPAEAAHGGDGACLGCDSAPVR